jgi:hypothetical protein
MFVFTQLRAFFAVWNRVKMQQMYLCLLKNLKAPCLLQLIQ